MGKGLGLPETVGAVVAWGDWASDEVCAVVVKKEGVSEAVSAVAVEEDGVSEIADMVVFEEESVLGRIGCVVVVREENSETYDIVVEEGVLDMAESVVVERGLSWAMQ